MDGHCWRDGGGWPSRSNRSNRSNRSGRHTESGDEQHRLHVVEQHLSPVTRRLRADLHGAAGDARLRVGLLGDDDPHPRPAFHHSGRGTRGRPAEPTEHLERVVETTTADGGAQVLNLAIRELAGDVDVIDLDTRTRRRRRDS